MAEFFPRHTVEWHLHEPAAFRRLSLSLAGMAVTAGAAIRVYRWLYLGFSSTDSWGVLIAAFAGGATILLGLATVHLGNYPVRHWVWRAPAFGAITGVAEAAASAALIAGGVERLGTQAAHWSDWQSLALQAIVRDTLAVSLFALVLAGVVQMVRYALLRREHRDSTAIAVHENHEAMTQSRES